MLREGHKLYAVYSVDDGESLKTGGQKVIEPECILGLLIIWPWAASLGGGSEWTQAAMAEPWE